MLNCAIHYDVTSLSPSSSQSLQRQVTQLSNENEVLKNIVKQHADNRLKSEILSNCKTEMPVDAITASTSNSATCNTLLGKSDFHLMEAIQTAQRSFIITDPSLPDNPIIFASKGFLDLCGYKQDEVLGRNCRFLQGQDTDPTQITRLRKGIMDGADTSVCLLNYKADGTPFYNQVFVAALRDSQNKIVNYVGVQVEVTCNNFTYCTYTLLINLICINIDQTREEAK